MKTASVADARRVLRSLGADGWPELTRRYGRTFRIQGSVVSADPAVARAVLTHRPHIEKRPAAYRLMDRMVPGAPGILFKDGEEWVRRLRVLMPSFSPARVVLRVGYNLQPDHPAAAALAAELLDYKFTTMRNDERYRMDELGLPLARLRHLPWVLAGLLDLRRRTSPALGSSGRMRASDSRVRRLTAP
jgi:hypothetical protein